MANKNKFSLVVLISGSGSNLQAIIDLVKIEQQIEIKAVISNKAGAYGLQRAENTQIETAILNNETFENRQQYDQALADLISQYQPDLIVLAGFMRILSAQFVEQFKHQLINIHPSLLPKFKGLHTHQRALEEKQTKHGASVHFVTQELDGGPVILQAEVIVKKDDTEATLAHRVLTQEHLIYPLVIKWLAQGRLKMTNQLIFDNTVLTQPLLLNQVIKDAM